MDGIYLAFLQNGGQALPNQFVLLYKARLRIGHMPEGWQVAKIIFIPKPGTASYNLAKAYVSIP